jgi:5-methylcytosine-specific restriction enzyme subunit McrC
MLQAALTAFEHQPLPITPGGDASSLSEAEVEQLLWVADSLPGFCSRGYRTVKLSEHCGLLNLGGRILEILPKVGEHPDATQGRGVLLRMLRVATDLPLHRQDTAAQTDRHAPLLEIFIRAFFEEVLLLLKGGLLRRYTERDEDLLAVRGTIQLQRQFTTLANRTDFVACRYDELTPDNRWNRLLKAGLKIVRPWIRSPDLERSWGELFAAFEEVGDVAHPRALLADLRYDRQATRYRPAIQWVERILNLLSPDLRSGAKPAPGLLFDMNLLFERVVEQRMARWASERGWIMEMQDTSRCLTEIISEPKRPAYRVKPDLVFKYRGKVVAIADAKWKRPDVSKSGFILPSQPDLYQLHAYAAVFQCSQLALIYPWSDRFIATQPTVFELPAVANKVVQIAIHSLDLGSDVFPIFPTLSLGRPNSFSPHVCC